MYSFRLFFVDDSSQGCRTAYSAESSSPMVSFQDMKAAVVCAAHPVIDAGQLTVPFCGSRRSMRAATMANNILVNESSAGRLVRLSFGSFRHLDLLSARDSGSMHHKANAHSNCITNQTCLLALTRPCSHAACLMRTNQSDAVSSGEDLQNRSCSTSQ